MELLSNYTKIVATLGPASDSYAIIRQIIENGARVLRLNFSHGSHSEQQRRFDWARQASQELKIPIAIFQDLQGPKIRIGKLGEPQFSLTSGEEFILTTEECVGTRTRVSVDYPYLHTEIKPQNRVLIDDGLIALSVIKVVGKEIHCRVTDGGIIKPHKGVNLPGVPLQHLSSFTDKDAKDLAFAFANDADYVALSFVRSAADVAALRTYMRQQFGREIPIISKIEKPEAVENLIEIMDESSAIMVARGDLGVEMYPEEVPLIQKSIIRACHSAGLPVITATQMLESMMHNARPTRAETNDVANAVLDGSSAVMLSGETAVGSYPVQTVAIMDRIIGHTEKSEEYKRLVLDQGLNREHVELRLKRSVTEAVGLATRELALAIQATKIVCFTQSGSTARRISKFRPSTPIIAFTPSETTVRFLALSWGVLPVLIKEIDSIEELLNYAPQHLKELGWIKSDQIMVITAGVPVGHPGTTNMIKVVEVE